MTHEIEAMMKEKINAALRDILSQRKEAIRERLLSCLVDHIEQELTDYSEPPTLDDALFALPAQFGETPPAQPTQSAQAPSSTQDLSELMQATQQLNRCADQISILECLIEGAARFSDRSVVFVCRNGQAMGWKQSGFAADPQSTSIRGAVLPLAEDSVLSRVVASGEGLSSDEACLADPVWNSIGTEPSASFTAVPLTVRGRIAAILFADAGTEENQKPLQADGLNILARMAEMSLETMTLRAEQGRAMPTAPAQQQEAAHPEPERIEEPRASVAAVEPTPVAPPPHVMSAPPEEFEPEAYETSAPVEPVSATEPPQVESPTEHSSPAEEDAVGGENEAEAETEAVVGDQQEEPPAPAELSAAQEAEVDPAATEAEAAPFAPQASAPDSEEEQLHEQARRFARLLISEILLYNPDQVQEGKQQHDLADRLKEDLERSEQMYRQRVAPHVAAETNYFQEEVVRTLADGDSTALGN